MSTVPAVRWAQKLSLAKLEQISSRLGLTEVHGPDGGPFTTIVGNGPPGAPTPDGETRIFTGDGVVEKVVYHALKADFIGLDSHMIFAFTAADSGVPHWTFDSVLNDPIYAFHLDLIPRADLGVSLAYMDGIYGPLTETHTAGVNHEGFSAANLGPRQRSIMSHWMLAYRVEAETYPSIDPLVQAYLDHWYELVENGVPADVDDELKGVDLAARDEANRALIFNREVDAVWNLITPLVGVETSELMRLNLATNEVVHEVPAGFSL